VKPPATPSARVAAHRLRKLASGFERVTVLLSPDAAQRLRELGQQAGSRTLALERLLSQPSV